MRRLAATSKMHNTMRMFIAPLAVVLASCGGGDNGADTTGSCKPALVLTPANATIAPLAMIAFSASGGRGTYTYELQANASGGRIDATTGAYLAGSTTGGIDTVAVHAEGCSDVVTAQVQIPDVLDVQPSRAEVPPKTSFKFVVTRGSGSYGFALPTNSSGAQLDSNGVYTAGELDGDDVVRVSDAVTGSFKDVRLAVRASARLDADPPRIGLPLGSQTTLQARGGSGHVTGAPSSGVATYADGVLHAVEVGRTEVTLTDVFTQQTATLTVVVTSGLAAPTLRGGDQDAFAGILMPPVVTADLDSDSVDDVLVGYADTSSSAAVSGSVYAFTRLADATSTALPTLQLDGHSARERFGAALAVADFDGDGHADLAVGAPFADVAFPDAGAVYIYRGDGSGHFDTVGVQVFSGDAIGDNFGAALAACDFDGDGAMDLAVGAPAAEMEATNRGQGLIALVFGGSAGLASGGMQRVYGALPDGANGMVAVPGLALGSVLAAADANDDGRCEVYAGAAGFTPSGGVAGSGAIVAYGVDSTGAFTSQPTMVVRSSGSATSPELGRSIIVRDLDKDGVPELLTGERGTSSGRALVFRIHHDGTQLATGDAALVLAGSTAGDACGGSADALDIDGDTALEIVVGCSGLDTAASDAGGVSVYEGRAGQLPLATPSVTLPGSAIADHFGNVVVAVGDVNDDGHRDLVVHARDADSNGLNFGALRLVTADGSASSIDLALPGRSSLQALGGAVIAVGDSVWVGAPGANVLLGVDNVDGLDAGRVLRYRDGELVATYEKHATHGTGDLFGTRLASLGDFDGDGAADVAVLAANDKRPTSFPATYVAESSCPGATGAVYVYSGDDTTPRFVVFGPAGDLASVAGGFDYDHDGKADLAIGGTTWDGKGGVRIYLGRSSTPGSTSVLCAPELDVRGSYAGDHFGGQLTALGDLDGDGCDELAIAADNYETAVELQNEGGVVLLYGTGAGCTAGPRYAVIHSGVASAAVGASLAAANLDGAGAHELVIGSTAYARAGITYGGYWIINGDALAAVTPAAAQPYPLVELAVSVLLGPDNGEQFGGAVTAVDATDDAPGYVYLGIPSSSDSGVARSGAVFVYPYDATTGLSDVAAARYGGESGPDGNFGAVIAVGDVVVIGAPASDGVTPNAVSVDDGEAYVFELTSP